MANSNALESQRYMVYTQYETIKPKGQFILQLVNPPESDVYIRIYKIVIGSNVESFTYICRNLRFFSEGYILKPQNYNIFGFDNSVIISKYVIPDIHLNMDTCDLIATYIHFEETEVNEFTIDYDGVLRLYPNKTFNICINNRSDKIGYMNILVTYLEGIT